MATSTTVTLPLPSSRGGLRGSRILRRISQDRILGYLFLFPALYHRACFLGVSRERVACFDGRFRDPRCEPQRFTRPSAATGCGFLRSPPESCQSILGVITGQGG